MIISVSLFVNSISSCRTKLKLVDFFNRISIQCPSERESSCDLSQARKSKNTSGEVTPLNTDNTETSRLGLHVL